MSYRHLQESAAHAARMDPANPGPGWNAVSISVWKLARFYTEGPIWPDREKVQIRIGRGILLWHFPPLVDRK